ncbi:MAG: HNH endonuclease [Terracidiphilus sp.]
MGRGQQNQVFNTAHGENETYNTQAKQAFNLPQQDAGNFESQLAKFSMVREMDTTETRIHYDTWMLTRIWLNSKEIPGMNGVEVRIDRFGNLMRFSEYGKRTEHGWEVDHNIPKSQGGSDDISNLEPLHWRANRQKSDHLL